MLSRALYLTSALSTALIVVCSAGAQPPDQSPRDGSRAGPGRRAGPPGGFAGGGIERVLDDLKLSEKKREQADAAVKEYQENVRKLMGMARSDLLMKLKDLLSDQEFKQFNETLDRPPALANARGRRAAGFFGRGLSVDQIVERIMSFDKNKDGKVTKDELPERMQNLIARGDTNKDGALDNEEIKKLAADLARNGSFRGFGDRGGPGARFGVGPGGRGGPGGFPVVIGIERALDDLKLSENKKQTAETAVKTYQDNTRKLMELARADLLMKMTPILSDEEFKTFKVALERRPGFGPRAGGRDGRFAAPAQPTPSRSADLEKRLEQLQQDLDNLRRELRR